MGATFIRDPGVAPRSIELSELFKRLPAMMRHGLLVLPLVVLAAAVWLVLEGGRLAQGLMAIAVVALLLQGYLAWLHYRKLTQYLALPGRVVGYSNPNNEPSARRTILHFDYEVAAALHHGKRAIARPRNLPQGASIWVLCNPSNPRDAIPWVE